MNKITKLAFLFLTIALAFGSFNPFSIASVGDITEQVEEQRGYTPVLFVICILLSLMDRKIIAQYRSYKQYYYPLLVLVVAYIFSGIAFDFSSAVAGYMFYAKLLVAFTGYLFFTMAFSAYPNFLESICRLFGCTCAIICLMFFLGILDGFYFFSNGRLWLFGENPNSYSFVLGFGALLLGNEMLSYEKKIYRILCAIGIILIIAFTFMSGSRGTLVCLGIGFIVMFSRFIRKHLVESIILVLASIWMLSFIFNNNVEELSILDRFADLKFGDSRQDLIKNALTLFYDSPILGYGNNGYEYMKRTVFHDMRDSHNMIVSILATTGIIGFFAIATFFTRFAKHVWSNKSNMTVIALFIYVFLISMKTGGIITYSMMWFAYSVIMSLSTKSSHIISVR